MFLTELCARAETCNFQEKERLIQDKIVFFMQGKHVHCNKIREHLVPITKAQPKSLMTVVSVETSCFVWNKTCDHCKVKNYFKVKCKKLQFLEVETDSDNSDSSWSATVNVDDSGGDDSVP